MKEVTFVPIKERHRISGSGSTKETYHIVLDLSGTDFAYTVGDCIGIYPDNPSDLVERTIQAMKASGEEIITDKRSQQHFTLKEFLTKKANIRNVNRSLIETVSKQCQNKEAAQKQEVWDFLLHHKQVTLPPQQTCDCLQALLPRLYSIASSQSIVGDEIHLIIKLHKYTANEKTHVGIASHYLCYEAPIGKPTIPIYLHPHKGFTLPEDPLAPMIMIGPGTGVAPFRGFLQERTASQATGQNWLFFGEWTQKNEFYYEEEWQAWQNQGSLRLNTAFSRDQEHKVYVQHRILEHANDVWQWLQNNSYIYLCGDKCLAKEIENALHTIIQNQGNLSENDSKQYLKQLRKDKRYLKDVY